MAIHIEDPVNVKIETTEGSDVETIKLGEPFNIKTEVFEEFTEGILVWAAQYLPHTGESDQLRPRDCGPKEDEIRQISEGHASEDTNQWR
jgi:hypothetical protein